MQSEFCHVALDRIRYSLVWEDAATFCNALQITPGDHVLVVTSAGCNALHALLQHPASVTAVDINPVQNELLLLKKHIILQHDHAVLRACMGLDGEEAVAAAWKKVQSTLPQPAAAYWTAFFQAHPRGLLTAGRLEAYITGFTETLDAKIRDKLARLLTCSSVEEQSAYFLQELHGTAFTRSFIEYFDDQNLSKGRDPKLFRYAEESGGQAFYTRLAKQLSSVLVAKNFFFRFFFFGPLHIPEEALPPCYRQQHFHRLQQALSKLTIVTAEAVDHLLSAGAHINKASLSNIFEYTSEQEFVNACSSLYKERHRRLRLVFWNLLHGQGNPQATAGWQTRITDNLSSPESCFYFKDVRILDNSPVHLPEPQPTPKT